LAAGCKVVETGQYEQIIPARMFNIYPYVLPVALFGEAGFKVANVVIVTLFLIAYYVLLKRDFSAHTAFLSSLIIISIPSSVITVTHLKEDFNALLLLTVSFIFLGRGAGRLKSFAAGTALGLAFLFKELPLVMMPFLAAYIIVNSGEVKSFRELFSRRPYLNSLPYVVSLVAGFAASILIFKPGHFLLLYSLWTGPGIGKFQGILSQVQKIGFISWKEGLLYAYPLHVLLILSVVVFIRHKNLNAILWLLIALVSYILISNNSAVKARHFVWSAVFSLPVIIESVVVLLRGVDRRKVLAGLSLVHAVIFGVAIFNVMEGLPALELRNKYNAQEAFFGGLKKTLPANSVLLGMDFCMLASYYSGLDCMMHPTYPDEKSCRKFLDEVEMATQRGRVYRLPDFFAYDSNGVCRKIYYDRFEERRVYSNYLEDFHMMTYGKSTEKYISEAIDERTCELMGEKETKDLEILPGLTLNERTLSFRCRDRHRPFVSLKLLEYKGRSFIFPASVYEIKRKT
jgi:4-amino-4-deoxy-L-arabinose transferase-like glycosyltransferase